MGYLIVLANDIIALVGLAAIFFRPGEPRKAVTEN